jgi:hypothetical protein
MNTIKLRLEGNKVFAKSAKSECEIAFHKSGDLCAKGHEQLQDARLFVVADPIWWLSDAAQSGEWADYEYEMKIAINGKL